MNFELPKGRNREYKLGVFAEGLKAINEKIGFKISSRGWAINKLKNW